VRPALPSSQDNGKTSHTRMKYWQNIYQRFVSKIYQELLTVEKLNSPIEKWVKELNRYLTKEDRQMMDKHMKACSISYVTRELQIKTRYHYTPHRG